MAAWLLRHACQMHAGRSSITSVLPLLCFGVNVHASLIICMDTQSVHCIMLRPHTIFVGVDNLEEYIAQFIIILIYESLV